VIVDDHLGGGLDVGVQRALESELAGLDLIGPGDRRVLDEGVGAERACRPGRHASGRAGHVLGELTGSFFWPSARCSPDLGLQAPSKIRPPRPRLIKLRFMEEFPSSVAKRDEVYAQRRSSLVVLTFVTQRPPTGRRQTHPTTHTAPLRRQSGDFKPRLVICIRGSASLLQSLKATAMARVESSVADGDCRPWLVSGRFGAGYAAVARQFSSEAKVTVQDFSTALCEALAWRVRNATARLAWPFAVTFVAARSGARLSIDGQPAVLPRRIPV
jgi:hypothetical protein